MRMKTMAVASARVPARDNHASRLKWIIGIWSVFGVPDPTFKARFDYKFRQLFGIQWLSWHPTKQKRGSVPLSSVAILFSLAGAGVAM